MPLTADPAYHREDAGRRLRLIADTYELTERQRINILALLARRTRAMYTFLAEQAAQNVQPWTRLWQEGHGDAWHADAEYITQHGQQWHHALLG